MDLGSFDRFKMFIPGYKINLVPLHSLKSAPLRRVFVCHTRNICRQWPVGLPIVTRKFHISAWLPALTCIVTFREILEVHLYIFIHRYNSIGHITQYTYISVSKIYSLLLTVSSFLRNTLRSNITKQSNSWPLWSRVYLMVK